MDKANHFMAGTRDRFTLIAHRGASEDAPENTFASFDLALEQGVNELEMDLHLTKGGVLVVIHDETVDRTTDGNGPVCEKTLEELQRLDAGSWFDSRFAGVQIPTLAEVLERYGQRAVLHLEMKANGDPQVAQEAVRLVKAWGLLGRVSFISFHPQQVAEVLRLEPGHQSGWLALEITPETIEQALSLGAWAIAPPAPSVTSEVVALAHEKGLQVRTWAVHTEDDLRRVIAAGCDGCTVNWPANGVEILASLKLGAS
jgi:glycerophosphoryl diester phosphodiesterase